MKDSKNEKFTAETALAFFARHLDALNWKYHRSEDRYALNSGFNGEEMLWDFNLTVHEKEPGVFLLGVNSFIPNRAHASRRVACAELLTRINFELAVGCFEMNWDEGEIRFRTNVVLPGSDITSGIVEHLVRLNICVVDERVRQIMNVLYGNTTPTEAINSGKETREPKPETRLDLN